MILKDPLVWKAQEDTLLKLLEDIICMWNLRLALKSFWSPHEISPLWLYLTLRPFSLAGPRIWSWPQGHLLRAICCLRRLSGAPLVAQTVKNLPVVWETQVQSLGQEDPWKKRMDTHCSILAWRILRTGEPGGLYSPCGRKESDTTEQLTWPCTTAVLGALYFL